MDGKALHRTIRLQFAASHLTAVCRKAMEKETGLRSFMFPYVSSIFQWHLSLVCSLLGPTESCRIYALHIYFVILNSTCQEDPGSGGVLQPSLPSCDEPSLRNEAVASGCQSLEEVEGPAEFAKTTRGDSLWTSLTIFDLSRLESSILLYHLLPACEFYKDSHDLISP